MRLYIYNQAHAFYAGVDLHARSMFTHVLDQRGRTVFERDLPACPDAFLDTVKPFRNGLVVGCECMFAWYWPADLCEDQRIPFVLGYALYIEDDPRRQAPRPTGSTPPSCSAAGCSRWPTSTRGPSGRRAIELRHTPDPTWFSPTRLIRRAGPPVSPEDPPRFDNGPARRITRSALGWFQGSTPLQCRHHQLAHFIRKLFELPGSLDVGRTATRRDCLSTVDHYTQAVVGGVGRRYRVARGSCRRY
jgi:hypothetical protein